ncbi:MAG TPA: ABC transporter permease DevC [Pirellulales bacterium]
MKQTPLAWLNLVHERVRTLVAMAGVAFAVILILMQLGFYYSVRLTASLVYDKLDFDLLLASPDYLYMVRSGTLPRERLYLAESHPDVADAMPLYIGLNLWRMHDTGHERGILLLGIDPVDRVFLLPELNRQRRQLERPYHVLMDRMSHPDFGPHTPGTQAEIGGKRIDVVGNFTLGTGFSADGAVACSDLTFSRLMPGRPLESLSLGLVKLRPGAVPERVAGELATLLPEDVVVYTRPQINAQDRQHWIMKTSVGIIFGLGVILALLVGVAIVYQVLSSDIDNRLSEYATLKAMGFPPSYLSRTVLTQALILAVGGFIPGVMISQALYSITSRAAHLPMKLTLPMAAGVFVLGVLMCAISGLLALRKVQKADPATLLFS